MRPAQRLAEADLQELLDADTKVAGWLACYTGVANLGDTFMNECPLTAAPEVVAQVGD